MVEFPLAGVLAVIAWLEGELVRIGRARKAEMRAGVGVGARMDAGFRDTLSLVTRLTRVDALYWRLAAWNRVVERKRRVLAEAEADEAARDALLGALGGVAACERWERRAAGLAAWARRERQDEVTHSHTDTTKASPSPGSSRGLSRPGSIPRKAPGQTRGRDIQYVLPTLPPLSRKAHTLRGGTRAGSPALDDMPVPVWPCEVLPRDLHAEVMARVTAAVREKDAELARQAAAKGSGRRAGERHARPKTTTGMKTARERGERRDPRSANEVQNSRPSKRVGADAKAAGWKPP